MGAQDQDNRLPWKPGPDWLKKAVEQQSRAPGNPDRSQQYKDASPETLLKQLNENWTKVRIIEHAVGDRDRVIDQLHRSVKERDVLIKRLGGRLRYAKIRVALLYALIGGAAAKGVEALVIALAHFVIAWLRHHS